jgi:hypothetical protein
MTEPNSKELLDARIAGRLFETVLATSLVVAQFQGAFPEYRLLKVIPSPGEARPRRRQTLRNEPNATLIGTASNR